MQSSVSYIPYDHIGITLAVIAIALTFIVLVWNAIKAIHDWRQMARRPTTDTLADHGVRLHKIEERLDGIDKKLDGDWEFRQQTTEMTALLLRSIKHLMQHAVDGDDVESLKSMEREIDDFLLKHM